MQRITQQKRWGELLLLSYLLFSYYTFGGWWNSSIGTILIIIFSSRIWPNDYLKVTGLNSKFSIEIIGLKNMINSRFCSLYEK